MRILPPIVCCFLAVVLSCINLPAQDSATTPAAKVPLERVIGTISAVDKSAQTVTVQEDKTALVHVIHLADAKTILKVEPTAKDLKNAARISADNLEVGDRVDVRGMKATDVPADLNARSVILMSARSLEQSHQQQAAAWTHSTNGVVTAVNASDGTLTLSSRSGATDQSITVKTSASTEIIRYSADAGKAVTSQLSQIETGDRVRVIGIKSEDGAMVTAQRLYCGAFRTISATVSSLGADGKSMTVKDLSTKKDVTVALTSETSIHKLPPMMAGMLARRLNPSAAGAPGAPSAAGPDAPPSGRSPSATTSSSGPDAPASAGNIAVGGPPAGRPGVSGPSEGTVSAGGPGSGQGAPGGSGGGRGDISQMIERTPKISLSDLKPGDAVVISGVGSSASAQLSANTVIAGVEPILQAAPQQRGGRSVGGDWGLGEMSAPQ